MHCNVNPNIPIYLIVAGAFYIVECSFRIYATWPIPEHSSKSLIGDIVRKGTEVLLLIFLLVWLILGKRILIFGVLSIGKEAIFRLRMDLRGQV